jgi:hypothetical protein
MQSTQLSVVLVAASCLLAAPDAEACGGCFHVEDAVAISAVTGHRMAFAVSETRTVLWDQIQYSGSPADFSWVLPVRPGAYVEASTDAWFEALDGVTQVRVASPRLNCIQPDRDDGGGIGCGSSLAASSDEAAPGLDNGYDNTSNVTVVHQGTVGPYETVTLRSTDPDALTNWLRDHRYAIPADIEPVISAYVAEEYDFLALRLQPNVGVQQMTPVRVVTPGGEGRLPLRMVAAGVGESVDIVLYVISESRGIMPDLHEVKIDSPITWDFAASSSNYLELRRQALARNLGFSYLTAFSAPQAFVESYQDPNGFPLRFFVGNSANTGVIDNFWKLYFAQAFVNDGSSGYFGACPDLDSALRDDRLVLEVPAAGEAEERSANDFKCSGYTDIAAALVGMHPARVWTTRLELKLPKEALNMDCVITPATVQEPVSQMLSATRKRNPPCAEAPQNSIAGRRSSRAPWVAAVFAALVLLRRRTRRTAISAVN